MLLISSKVFDDLTPQVQGWVLQAAKESSDFQRELWSKKTETALEEAKAEGVEIYDVDTALFYEKVKPMLNAVENPEVRSLLDQIGKVE